MGVDPAPASDRLVAGVESVCVTGKRGLSEDDVAGFFCTAKSGGFLTFADNAGTGYELLSVKPLDTDLFDMSNYPDPPERWFVSFGGYGPIVTGMTARQLSEATNSAVELDEGQVCSYIDIPDPDPGLAPAVVVIRNGADTVDGLYLSSDTKATTELSIGIGSSLASVLAAYRLPDESPVQGAFGEWFVIVEGADAAAAFGFSFGYEEPTDRAEVEGIYVGSADFAQGYSGCPE